MELTGHQPAPEIATVLEVPTDGVAGKVIDLATRGVESGGRHLFGDVYVGTIARLPLVPRSKTPEGQRAIEGSMNDVLDRVRASIKSRAA